MSEVKEIKAKLRYLRISPRKVRKISDVLRGKNLDTAIKQLDFIVQRPSGPLKKLLKSAAANARHNFKIEDTGNLFIKEIRVDKGPMQKRFRPRAFGVAAPIKKRTSYVDVILVPRKTKA